jgi:hypothetical protein
LPSVESRTGGTPASRDARAETLAPDLISCGPHHFGDPIADGPWFAPLGAVVQSVHPRRPDHVVEILQYYVNNPDAIDTLEGIASWRLLEDFVRRRVEETGEALRWLVEQGLLESIGGAPGVPPLYRLSPRADRRREAERLVARATSRRPRSVRRRP